MTSLFRTILTAGIGLLKKAVNKDGKKNWAFRLERFTSSLGKGPFMAHASWRSYFSEEEASKMLQVQVEAGSTTKGYLNKLHEGEKEFQGDFVNQLLYGDFRTWLVGNNFFKLDRATSLNSLEGRVPLISSDLVTYAFSKNGKSKHSIRSPKQELLSLAKKVLPKEIADFSKSSFQPPLEKWFSGELRSWMEESLLNGALVGQFNFKESEIRKVIFNFDSNPRLEVYRIQNLLCLEYWLRAN